jgi:hypothetical protein
MHPLLIPEVAAAFFLMLGLTRAAGAGPLPGSSGTQQASISH